MSLQEVISLLKVTRALSLMPGGFPTAPWNSVTLPRLCCCGLFYLTLPLGTVFLEVYGFHSYLLSGPFSFIISLTQLFGSFASGTLIIVLKQFLSSEYSIFSLFSFHLFPPWINVFFSNLTSSHGYSLWPVYFLFLLNSLLSFYKSWCNFLF